MTLIQINSNKTLKGHKALLLTQKPVEEFVQSLQSQFPDLEIVSRQVGADRSIASIPDELWKDTTILVTGSGLPTREQAPKLQYVQLTSAGADSVVKSPLFKEKDIAFCTANGVHG